MNQQLLEKYAKFAIKSAVNLQKGQTLIIGCPVEGAFFARLCAKAAYEAGAREVVMHYDDEQISRLRMQHTDVEVLEDIKPWILRSYMDYVEGEGGASILRILASDPEIYKGLDTGKISRASVAKNKAMEPWTEQIMANRVQWSIVAIASPAWAKKVFPTLPTEQAVERLWENIFSVSRVQGGDPVHEWEKHVDFLLSRQNWLNDLKLDRLHFENAAGTNLVVGLPKTGVWCAAQELSTSGVPFLANVPTEEVFTGPDRLRVDGVVKSSIPYVYNGNLIEGMTIHFKDGLVTEYSAEKGEELLRQMLEADEGAKRLGEIALVPATSPIRKTGLLFYNTLFDENAACHMAFGAGYPNTVQGGESLTKEQLLEKGINDSVIHEDVMIGTADMQVTGYTVDGRAVPIFQNGEWAKAEA